jgi:hypothetical protein
MNADRPGGRQSGRMAGLEEERPGGWQADRQADRQYCSPAGWHAGILGGCQVGRMAVRKADSPGGCQSGRLTGCQARSLAFQKAVWRKGWPCRWLADQYCGRPADCEASRLSGQRAGRSQTARLLAY